MTVLLLSRYFSPHTASNSTSEGDDGALVLAQVPEDVEFQRRESQLPAVEAAFPVVPADVQTGKVIDLLPALRSHVIGGVAAELRLHPGHQLQGLKGLVM